MKVKFDHSKVNNEDFIVSEHEIAGEKCIFTRPSYIMATWTTENLIYRSSIWNSSGDLISASYPKFFNLEEKPDITPYKNCIDLKAVEKLDGSTLIVSFYKDELIIRTRGSINTVTMDNHDEIEYFKKKYSSFFDYFFIDHSYRSFLFEWVSPRNKIILDYPEPELYLTNIISHNHYLLTKQEILDDVAEQYGFKRPKRFQFETLTELVSHIETLTDYEGVCLYYNNDQNIRKIKSLQYLKLHAFKSELNTKNIALLYLQLGKPNIKQFESFIENQYDYECLVTAQPYINKLDQVSTVLNNYVYDVKLFVDENKELTQKDFALKVQAVFDDSFRKAISFSIRKGEENVKAYKTRLLDDLKKYDEELTNSFVQAYN